MISTAARGRRSSSRIGAVLLSPKRSGNRSGGPAAKQARPDAPSASVPTDRTHAKRNTVCSSATASASTSNRSDASSELSNTTNSQAKKTLPRSRPETLSAKFDQLTAAHKKTTVELYRHLVEEQQRLQQELDADTLENNLLEEKRSKLTWENESMRSEIDHLGDQHNCDDCWRNVEKDLGVAKRVRELMGLSWATCDVDKLRDELKQLKAEHAKLKTSQEDLFSQCRSSDVEIERLKMMEAKATIRANDLKMKSSELLTKMDEAHLEFSKIDDVINVLNLEMRCQRCRAEPAKKMMTCTNCGANFCREPCHPMLTGPGTKRKACSSCGHANGWRENERFQPFANSYRELQLQRVTQ